MSIDPRRWGPGMWRSIHWIAAAYPNEPTLHDKSAYNTYFTSLGNVLPCKTCRQEYKLKIQHDPIRLESRRALQLWCSKLHNDINRRVHGRVFDYPASQLDIDYSNEQVCKTCQNKQ